jgi:hypothetical protein
MYPCRGCGAVYETGAEGCGARFDTLLALDHSRREPWGSRHGLAFAAFALQHPDRHPPAVVERSWQLLYLVYEEGQRVERVLQGLARSGKQPSAWKVPPLPPRRPARFDLTIADLGDFEAVSYPDKLDAWCRAALEGWTREPDE